VGVMLKEFQAYTTDEEWKTKGLITGQDVTYKVARVKALTLFMDYSAEKLENGSSAISDSLTADLEILQQDTNNTKFLEILEREFKLLEEASSHQYILDKFSLESRLKLNKNPKVNELP